MDTGWETEWELNEHILNGLCFVNIHSLVVKGNKFYELTGRVFHLVDTTKVVVVGVKVKFLVLLNGLVVTFNKSSNFLVLVCNFFEFIRLNASSL